MQTPRGPASNFKMLYQIYKKNCNNTQRTRRIMRKVKFRFMFLNIYGINCVCSSVVKLYLLRFFCSGFGFYPPTDESKECKNLQIIRIHISSPFPAITRTNNLSVRYQVSGLLCHPSTL